MSSTNDSDAATDANAPKKDNALKQPVAEKQSSTVPDAVAKEKPASPKSESMKKPEQTKKAPSDNKSGKSKAVVWVVVALVLIGALLGGGWWSYGYLNQYLEQQLHNSKQANARDLQQLTSQLEQERQARLVDIGGLRQTTDEISNRINSQGRRLRELSGTTRSDWLLAEAEYLIRLGIQRFITERNTTNSIALMESADQILSQLDEVDLLPVRRTLARDITTLRLVKNVDREGLYLKLGAIGETVMSLPLIPRQPEAAPETEQVSASQSEDSTWQEQFANNISGVVDQLQSLIKVQRRTAAIKPLLSVNEEVYIRHNLRFMVEQAQLALLREEQVVYRESLNKGAQWMRDYFQLDEQSQQLVAELEELGQVDIQANNPNIGSGLAALQDYIDSWHSQYIVVPADNSLEGNQPTEETAREEEQQ